MQKEIFTYLCLMLGFVFTVAAQSTIPYDLIHPVQQIELPDFLTEISGISLSTDQKTLWAVQDEAGVVYHIDLEREIISDSISFWKAGDYEDIEVVGNQCYVLKSTGTVYAFPLSKDSLIVTKCKGELSRENNAEGLCYDALNSCFLIACKNGEKQQERHIYSVQIKQEHLLMATQIDITQSAILDYLNRHNELNEWEKLYKNFSKTDFEFAPSAIAVHPVSQQYYLLSSQGKTLFVLNRDGSIAHIEKLDKSIHQQPEGLCFDTNGNLYLSNEGKKGRKAVVYRFDMVKQ